MKWFRDLTPDGPLTTLDSVSDELNPNDLANVQEVTYFLVGQPDITVGAAQVEAAHVSGYAGTWAAEGSPVTVAADTCKTVKVSGVGMVGRVRASTGFDGDGLKVYAMGR